MEFLSKYMPFVIVLIVIYVCILLGFFIYYSIKETSRKRILVKFFDEVLEYTIYLIIGIITGFIAYLAMFYPIATGATILTILVIASIILFLRKK